MEAQVGPGGGGPVAAGTDFRGGDSRAGRTCTRRRRRRRGKLGGPVSRGKYAPGFWSVGSKFPRFPRKFFSPTPSQSPSPGQRFDPATLRGPEVRSPPSSWAPLAPGTRVEGAAPRAATERIQGGLRGGEKRRFGARPLGGAQAPQSPVREGGPGGPTLVGRGVGWRAGQKVGLSPT